MFYNKRLKHLSRVLRKNMTQSEIVLWARVRKKQLKGLQFYRQKIIRDYIVDFYCPSAKLIVQVDGSHHLTERGLRADSEQDSEMNRIGLRVLRFSSVEVLENTDGVVSESYEALAWVQSASPLDTKQVRPPPFVTGEGRGFDNIMQSANQYRLWLIPLTPFGKGEAED